MAIRTILCPLDFSATSDAVLRAATSLALAHQAALRLLYVQEGAPPYDYLAGAISLAQAQQQLAAGRQAAEQAGLTQVSTEIRQGEAAPSILAEAAERQADAIVLGAHGRTNISRFLMGSTAEQVLRCAPCPTVLIHTQLAQPAAPLAVGS